EGGLHTFSHTNQDGTVEQREEFVAKRIGHDTAVTNYQIDRSPRRAQTPQAETGVLQGQPHGLTMIGRTPPAQAPFAAPPQHAAQAAAGIGM
ncbi:MAG: hypothetical protein LBJ08_03090, partial [Bifidobacteriaceae bacterium]|nr:hypothetical protein [Bifidobacteriaceae bacterium]